VGFRSELSESFLQGIPFAYLLNQSEFYHHKFFVNEDVLIPRPETEYMVDLLVSGSQRFDRVADVGCGSGVILLSLLKAGVAKKGVGFDLSEKALAVSKINARRLRLESNTKFVQADRLTGVTETFDAIISNPPYIKAHAHKPLVQLSVDLHEPAMALYLEDETYKEWFQVFFEQIRSRLNPGGLFMMEGHELELQDQSQTLVALGFLNVQVLKDLSGQDRFLKALAP
jgi:release factor glutamine methyltransferase